jgi:MFS family permease
VANAIRGIGWGGINTAGPTAVAMCTPPSRRGEASGHFSVITTAVYGLTPALSVWLYTATGSFVPIVVLAGLSGVVGGLVLRRLPPLGDEGQSLREAMTWQGGRLRLESFVDRGVLLASLLLLCMSLTTPVSIAFVPLHAISLNVENIGLYFILGSATSIAARLLIGRRLDSGTRGQWLVAGYLTMMIGFAVLMLATRLEMFLLASVINAVGQSIANPTLLAVAMDRAERSRMGKAMATFSMFYRAGEGIGAPIAGALIAAFGFTGMYVGAIISVSVGIVMAAVNWSALGKPIHAHPGTG